MTALQDIKIGKCRLILGDCLDLLNGLEGVDSLCSDPPYGMSYQSGHATDQLWGDDRRIIADQTTALRDGILDWCGQRPALVFGTWKVERPRGTRQVLIWDKKGALGMGALDIPWKPDHEEIYVLGKGFIGTRDCGSVIPCPPVQSTAQNGRQHPTEKPVQLMMALVRKLPGTVLDPCMGSGSTIVACARLGRPAIGIEIDPHHFETACARVETAMRAPDMFPEAAQ